MREIFKYAQIEMIADSDEKKIKLRKLVEVFEGLAKANGIVFHCHEDIRYTQSKNRYGR